MTKIQTQTVDILMDTWATFKEVAHAAGCSERALRFWADGQRIPRDVEVIERVLDALGYKLVILTKRGNPMETCETCRHDGDPTYCKTCGQSNYEPQEGANDDKDND